jgi:adenylate kinase
MMFLVFLGAPGAGKGTQSDVVADRLCLAHIASGDLFRQAVEKGTELGKLAKDYMDKGILVPDDVTIRLVSERLDEPDCENGCIFDGFPRTIEQARALDKMMADRGGAIDKAIDIEVPENELLKRLTGRWICRNCQTPYHEVNSPPKVPGKCDKCGVELYQRSDDTEETIKERLKVYFTQTAPLLDYYKVARKLVSIDGNKGINQVSEQILEALDRGSVKAK